MSCHENQNRCVRRDRNVVVRVDIGPIVAIVTAIVFAVLIARFDEIPSSAPASKSTKATTHRNVTVIPMGDKAPTKKAELVPNPMPVEIESVRGGQ